jgi:cation-transporting ATPase 13A1
VLLLHGTAVLNEAMLTGETVPQLKEPPPAERAAERLGLARDRAHVLCAGTTVVQHAAGGQPKALQPPDGGAVGFVLRTGYATTQGKLLRTILFSREPVSANNREVLVYIICLLACALVAAGHGARAAQLAGCVWCH